MLELSSTYFCTRPLTNGVKWPPYDRLKPIAYSVLPTKFNSACDVQEITKKPAFPPERGALCSKTAARRGLPIEDETTLVIFLIFADDVIENSSFGAYDHLYQRHQQIITACLSTSVWL